MAGFYTRVNRTYNSFQCLLMCGHQCSQAILAFPIKASVLATKSHLFNFCKAYASICCYYDPWEPITQDVKSFSVLRKKKAKLRIKNIATTFGKSLFLTQYRMRYVIYIPPNTRGLATNLTMVATTQLLSHEQTTPICFEH